MEIGINFSNSDSAYDVVLNSEFENEESLEIYQEHLEHLKVKEAIKRLREEIASVDYKV